MLRQRRNPAPRSRAVKVVAERGDLIDDAMTEIVAARLSETDTPGLRAGQVPRTVEQAIALGTLSNAAGLIAVELAAPRARSSAG